MSEAKRPEQYEATIVAVGNSRGMRLPAGFFNAHPEFSGKVRVTVVADGQVLVSARNRSRRKSADDAADPVLAAFLRFIEEQMARHPEDIVAADDAQLERIGKLVGGIAVD